MINIDKKLNIPFSPPDISELEIQEVSDALCSGWITTGPRTKKLEKMIAEYIGTTQCVCLNSQTACAEMALHVLGVGPGDEVITSAYTYTASASIVCHLGAKLVLIDTQKDNYEMDYDMLENAINERTKAIIPVDIGGVPCDYDRIFQAVENKLNLFKPSSPIQVILGRVAIMADTAHSFGANWHGRMTGNIADFSSFSFHAVKNLTTAEGGALTWKSIPGINDDDVYRHLQLLSLHGQSKDALAKTQLGSWEYDIVGPWYKCNMTDIAAALGIAQFKRYPAMLERRKEIIKQYDTAFKPLGVKVLPHYTDEYQSSGHLYLTRIPGIEEEQRNEIIIKMAERGISCNVHYKPLPMHTAYKKLGFDIKDYPNAYRMFANEVTLPLHTRLTDEQVSYVIDNYLIPLFFFYSGNPCQIQMS
jgi:dTDP-4-amino-4,6-dideoxygalactose transaminase